MTDTGHSQRGLSLLQMVLRAPDDDNARQVYGDWMAEHGDSARAELIRWQCEVARLAPWERRAIEARWEADALLAQHGARWRGELPQLAGVTWGDFERGFPVSVHCADVETLYKHADAIAAAAPVHAVELPRLYEATCPAWEGNVPWLRVLRLSAAYGTGHAIHGEASLLSRVPELEIAIDQYAEIDWLWERDEDVQLRRLSLNGEHIAGRAFADRLVHMPWVQALEQLALSTRFHDWDSGYYEDPTLRLEGAELLAGAKLVTVATLAIDRQRVTAPGLAEIVASLPALRELSARGCEVTDIAFLKASLGAPIVRLDLSNNGISNDGARTIAQASRTATLERLDLDTCEIGAPGVAALAASPAWHTLRWLDLSRNPLDGRGAAALAGAPRPEKLHTLALVDVDFEPEATHAVLRIPWLRELLALDLSRNALDDGTALARLAGGGLRQLALERVDLGWEAAEALAPLWTQLVHLELGTNTFGDDGIAKLVTGDESPLQTLGLAWCSLRDAGFATLAAARCPKLRVLKLAGNRPTAEGLGWLIRSPLLAHLETLDLARCELAGDAMQLIAASPQLGRLRMLDLRHNQLDEAGVLALARSPALRGIGKIRLTAEEWKFEPEARAELQERFGRGWMWDRDDDNDDDDDDDADDADADAEE